MSLNIYDTQARELREFRPLVEGKVGMYICGLTTQGLPHIGHMRFAVSFDILRRWLTRGHGYHVTLVRNVTDIDDKILRKSGEQGLRWWELSYANEQATSRSLETLGILPATYEPRATGHIPEMIAMIQAIIDRGHAYPAAGDVYFDVKSFPEYGALTHQAVDDMEAAEDADPRGKRDPRDFALWKGAKEGEPETASWDTPWGRGRPGWHIECSAMARKYLGDAFDIHGGAVDLRFPHHENEQAQSHAAGLPFTTYWMHNAWLTIKGEKMSKSVGQSLGVDHLTATYEPLVVRYYLSAPHYRSTLEYHPDALPEAQAAVDRLRGFVGRAVERLDADAAALLEDARTCELPAEFVEAMDDDLGVPGALAVVFETVRRGNSALDEADEDALRLAVLQVVAMTDVIGVNPLDPRWAGRQGGAGGDDAAQAALDTLVQATLEERARARQERDFATADAIRDRLTAAGILIEDTPAGARWSLRRGDA